METDEISFIDCAISVICVSTGALLKALQDPAVTSPPHKFCWALLLERVAVVLGPCSSPSSFHPPYPASLVS